MIAVRSSAARTNCDYIDYYIEGGGGNYDDVEDDVNGNDVALQSSFGILNFRRRFWH